MCIRLPASSAGAEREESLSSAPDLVYERIVQRADGLMDSVVIWGAFHVARKLASKVRDQQYDLPLGVVRRGRRELVDLRFYIPEQTLQFTRKLWQPRVRLP